MGLDIFVMKKTNKEYDEELLYWRKVNCILEWFDKNCCNGNYENCQDLPVTRSDLIDLLGDVELVLEDHSKAADILPTCVYGSTAYDNYYFADLKYTAESIKKVIPNIKNSDELYFYAWW